MHSRLYNRVGLHITLSAQGPLIVRAAHPSENRLLLDEQMVTTAYGDSHNAPYLPGSSIKGVIRSHFERIAASCGIQACDPFSSEACSLRLNSETARRLDEGSLYSQLLCPACKVFGCSGMAGRFWVRDALPVEADPPAPQLRSTVAVDRFLGSARPGSQVDYEVVVGGAFSTEMTLENFELWQLALVGMVLLDLDEGFVQLGGFRSKGHGLVSVTFTRCEFFFAKSNLPPDRLYGIGSLVSDQVREGFGYMSDDWVLLRRPQAAQADSHEDEQVHYEVLQDMFGIKYVFSQDPAIRSLFATMPKTLMDYAARKTAKRTSETQQE